MLKSFFSLFVLFLVGIYIPVLAQSVDEFEQGYIVLNDHTRIEVEIKNEDWVDNPSLIYYKINGKEHKASIKDIEAFGIPGLFKFIRASVDLDPVPDITSRLDDRPQPSFVRKTLFLKVLVEGDANLYMYKEKKVIRYFYNIDGGPIKPLVYKRYYISPYQIAENNEYRKTLIRKLKCPGMDISYFSRLSYKKKDLMALFDEYNKCRHSDIHIYDKRLSRNIYRGFVMLRGDGLQVNIISSSLKNFPVSHPTVQIHANGGIGFEYLLPFRHNRWGGWTGLFFRRLSSYQQGTSYDVINNDTLIHTAKLNYLGLEIPLMLRYYFYVRHRWKLFIDAGFAMNINKSSHFVYKKDDLVISDLKDRSKGFWNAGLGVRYGRFAASLQYIYNPNVIGKFYRFNAPASGYSFYATYTFWEYKH